MQKRSPLPELSPAQREIMQVVWERGEVTASEVRAVLSEKRQVARTTVRTILERMEQKGWLRHRKRGQTHFYSPAQPRRAAVAQKVLEVVDGVCGGSPETLVNALLDSRGLTNQELARIRAMLDQAQANKPIAKGR